MTWIVARLEGPSDGAAPPARPPTARRWPALRDLTLAGPGLVDSLRALGAEPWPRLMTLCIGTSPVTESCKFGAPGARALAAASPRLAALTELELRVPISAAELEEVLRGEWSALESLSVYEFYGGCGAALPPAPALAAQPRMRDLTLCMRGGWEAEGAMARWVAARGWPLEDLSIDVSDAGTIAALVAAPNLALQSLQVYRADAAALCAAAAAPWPLESLEFTFYATPSAAAFRALARAAWPELIGFSAYVEDLRPNSDEDSGDEGEALDDAAFALCPKMEGLHLSCVPVGATGVQALTTRLCKSLQYLSLVRAQLDNDALAPLSLVAWPALESLDLSRNKLTDAAMAALARGSWPALANLNLSINMLSDAALAALARGAWPALERLNLSSNKLSDAELAAAACNTWPTLVCLQLSNNLFSDDLIAALARREWPALVELNFRGAGIQARPTLADVRQWAPAMRIFREDP